MPRSQLTEFEHEYLSGLVRDLRKQDMSNSEARDKMVFALAGGSFLVSLTFLSDIAKARAYMWVLYVAWVALFLTIILTLIAYQIARRNMGDMLVTTSSYLLRTATPDQAISQPRVTSNAIDFIAMLSLVLGMACLGVFAVLNL